VSAENGSDQFSLFHDQGERERFVSLSERCVPDHVREHNCSESPLAYWQIDLRNLLPRSGIKPFATDEEGGGKSLGLAKFQTALSSATHLIVSKHEPRKRRAMP